MSPIKVLICDDHEIVRSGVRLLLLAEGDIDVIGESTDGDSAIEKAVALQPDVVVMDLQMPGTNGIDATRQIKTHCPKCAVLALTIYEDEQYFFQLISAGGLGYVPKRAAPDDLVRAIRTVNQGNVFLYPSMASLLVTDYLARAEAGDTSIGTDVLTEREQEVLTLVAQGLSNHSIAEQLSISTKTVERHRENIMNKLGLHSRTELVKYAIRKGLIDL